MSDPAPPLFVVGCDRSGSTPLRLMLDAHPDLAVPGESHFIPELRRRFPDPVDPEVLTPALLRTPHFRHWKVAESSVWERVRAMEQPRGVSGPAADVDRERRCQRSEPVEQDGRRRLEDARNQIESLGGEVVVPVQVSLVGGHGWTLTGCRRGAA